MRFITLKISISGEAFYNYYLKHKKKRKIKTKKIVVSKSFRFDAPTFSGSETCFFRNENGKQKQLKKE